MKKNVLLIISDQHRQEAMSCRGNGIVKTPNMDRLFDRGVQFNRAVSPAPLCGPARTSIFSGLYPHQARGILEEEALGARDDMKCGVLRDMMINSSSIREEPLLTNPFKKSGYYTAYAGKWHLGNDIINNWFDNAWGYDNSQYTDWLKEKDLPEYGWPLKDMSVRSSRNPPMSIPKTKQSPIKGEEYNDAWITDLCLDYLQERPQEDPFFICCGFNGPHPPFMIPEPWYSLYDPEDIPEPENFGPSQGEPACKKNSFYRQLWNDHGTDWTNWKKSVAVYYGFVSYIDHQIGRLIQKLEDQGVLDETLIIYTSDHGEMLGQHGLWHKMQAYEESLRVPLLFSAPWIAQQKNSSASASLLDIAPTIMGQAGFEIPASYEGRDLSSWLSQPDKTDDRQFVFSEQHPLGEFHKEVSWRMIHDRKYKYIWNRNDLAELYNLEEDPKELNNLSGQTHHEETEKFLKSELLKWMKETEDSLVDDISL